MFKLWSEQNSEAKKLLSPDLDLRDWNALSREEKDKIWHFLKNWFDKKDSLVVLFAILKLNDLHKFQSYAGMTLKDLSKENAFFDFKNIFFEQHQDVVIELLSCFCQSILSQRKNETGRIYRSYYKTDEEYAKALSEWRLEEFDNFSESLNDVFEHFSINLFLTRAGFVGKQDQKIINEIYVPVLNFLSLPKWDDVNRELSDAFKEYQAKTEQGYSSCITHTFSALQAFLQILVYDKVGSSEGISSLVKKAQEKDLIPADKFSSEIFKNIESILMRERGKTGDAHPKQEYANEKNARLVLNLVMIFIQHCIQK